MAEESFWASLVSTSMYCESDVICSWDFSKSYAFVMMATRLLAHCAVLALLVESSFSAVQRDETTESGGTDKLTLRIFFIVVLARQPVLSVPRAFFRF